MILSGKAERGRFLYWRGSGFKSTPRIWFLIYLFSLLPQVLGHSFYKIPDNSEFKENWQFRIIANSCARKCCPGCERTPQNKVQFTDYPWKLGQRPALGELSLCNKCRSTTPRLIKANFLLPLGLDFATVCHWFRTHNILKYRQVLKTWLVSCVNNSLSQPC